MKTGVIKRVGSNKVDVQLTGSTAVLQDVPVSSQISWDLLEDDSRVFVDFVNEKPFVLHTLGAEPNYYSPQPKTYTTVIENALLSDGSVPLQGNLNVFPGVTIDGYDVSVLGQAISNLQAADTIARTGWTAFTHGTHLVTTITASATTVIVRDAIFELYERAALSNTNGEVEFISIDSTPTSTLDDDGSVCYQYTVTRRVATSPSGLNTGWAASTLINGLTKRGYIVIDNRHRYSLTSPNMQGVVWRDDPPTQTETVFRFGGLYGILGTTENDFGVAIGNLTTQNTYLLFNSAKEELKLKNSDIVVDSDGVIVVNIRGKNIDDRLAGDYDFGSLASVHNSFYGDIATWGVYRNTSPIIEITEEHSYLRDLFTIGDQAGARIELGERNNESLIALRNRYGVIKFLTKTNTAGDVDFFVGNAEPESHRINFDGSSGHVDINGNIRMDQATIYNRLTISNNGYLEFIDEDDPLRKGVINRRGIVGYSVDAFGQQYVSSVDAWGPLTVTSRGITKTWLAGEAMKGDANYRHFRYERGPTGRLGLFNGDTPIVYISSDGKGYFSSEIEIVGNITTTDGAVIWANSNGRADSTGIRLKAYDLVSGPSGKRNWFRFDNSADETIGYFSAWYQSTTNSIIMVSGDNSFSKNAVISTQSQAKSGQTAEANIGATIDSTYSSLFSVNVDASSNPSAMLYLIGGSTSNVTDLYLRRFTSGTIAAGYGMRILWQGRTNNTSNRNMASVQGLWNNSTDGTRKADLIGTAYDSGGEREGWRIRGTGSAAAIGFLGATPAAQQSHVADPSGGATVDTQARSAINSILATLETFGLHATS